MEEFVFFHYLPDSALNKARVKRWRLKIIGKW